MSKAFTTQAGPVITSLQCLTAMLVRTLLSLEKRVSFPYSALLYMNDDFEGGEFIFTEMDAKTVTVRKAAPTKGLRISTSVLPSSPSLAGC